MDVTFETAASYFPLAADSHASSSNEADLFLKAASACLRWHLITVPIILLGAFTIASPHLRWSFESGGQPGSSPPEARVVAVVEVVVVVVVVATVVVVVGGVHGPNVPVTSAPLSGPLLVGVGQARSKSLQPGVLRVRLKVPSPGVAVAGEDDAHKVRCGPV